MAIYLSNEEIKRQKKIDKKSNEEKLLNLIYHMCEDITSGSEKLILFDIKELTEKYK